MGRLNLPGAVFSGRALEGRAAARGHLTTVCYRAGKAVPLEVPDAGTIVARGRGSGSAGARTLLYWVRLRFLAACAVLPAGRLPGEAGT